MWEKHNCEIGNMTHNVWNISFNSKTSWQLVALIMTCTHCKSPCLNFVSSCAVNNEFNNSNLINCMEWLAITANRKCVCNYIMLWWQVLSNRPWDYFNISLDTKNHCVDGYLLTGESACFGEVNWLVCDWGMDKWLFPEIDAECLILIPELEWSIMGIK